MDTDDFGKRLEKARKAAGLTPSEVAKRLGIAYSTVKNHENGHRGARKRASDYARLYGVNVRWLLDDAGPMKGPKKDPVLDLFESLPKSGREEAIKFMKFLKSGQEGP